MLAHSAELQLLIKRIFQPCRCITCGGFASWFSTEPGGSGGGSGVVAFAIAAVAIAAILAARHAAAALHEGLQAVRREAAKADAARVPCMGGRRVCMGGVKLYLLLLLLLLLLLVSLLKQRRRLAARLLLLLLLLFV
jgi:hypothetical protein